MHKLNSSTLGKVSGIKFDGKIKVSREKRKYRIESTNQERGELRDAKSPIQKKCILSTKEEQAIETLNWLEENFTRCPGVCLPRCIMYAHYLDFCQEHKFRPSCAATFGKIIRQKFPELTTRRLGTRGNSKYHYYGVAIKESSPYYHTVYTGRGLTRFSGSKLLNENEVSRKIIASAKSGTLLPEFPSPSQLILPSHVEMYKMDTLMIMYRTHCQCILDTAVARNYEGIHQYLVHFWKGIPKHLKSLFEVPEIVSLVCICDSIMYMVLNDILVPVSLEDVTDQSLAEVRSFAQNLENWLEDGLKDGNQVLSENKLAAARRFVQAIKRQLSFLHLAQSFREVLSDKIIASNLLRELDAMDIRSIGAQAIYTMVDCTKDQTDLHEEYLRQLRELLRSEATVESYIEWLESIYQNQVMQYCESDAVSFKLRAQEFLLSWSFFGTRVMHMLTLNNSRTYGPFHLIRMMLDEYLLLVTETRFYKQEQMELQKLSEQLIKGSPSYNLKISNIVTKSKFGAPTKHSFPPKHETDTLKTKALRNIKDQLPPIATLQNKTSHDLKMNNLPNDHFSKRHIENNEPAFTSLVTLTPPSSPTTTSESPSSISSSTSKPIVSSSVENLVDEHFRNCGIDQFTNPPKDELAGYIQRFLSNQDQTLNPYEVSDDVYLNNNSEGDENADDDDIMMSPLQCSFSQILKGDVSFSDQLNDTYNATLSERNSGKNRDFSIFNNFSKNLAYMESLLDSNLDEMDETKASGLFPRDDDEQYASIENFCLQY